MRDPAGLHARDWSKYRLGRQPADPAALAAVQPHHMGDMTVPTVLERPELVWTPTLCQNDMLPTCTIAGLMNAARMWSLVHGGFDLVNVEDDLLGYYANLAGCPDTPAGISATDGLDLLTVLKAANTSGFTVGEQTPLVAEYRAIDISDSMALKSAIASTGAAYVGVTVYENDLTAGIGDWSAVPAGNPIGGHCILLWKYNEEFYGAATWGETMPTTPDWLAARIEEAYAVSWALPVAVGQP